ncbi:MULTISPECIES: S1 family peptidase [unclassified Nocardia]|uniref:S1 family peptidase n=1 Tax=unclassified Nocardia TaxID=2637762 RepID=UPI001CE3EBD8|nr:MULTISPECIES: S1 family peptidase [unclassified Nocardia]
MFSAGRTRVVHWVAAAVTALAATSVFSGGTASAEGPAVLGGGSGLYIETSEPDTVSECTLTAIGFDRDNKLVGLTAGHCGEIGMRVAAEYSPKSGVVGKVAAKSVDNDWAVIELDPARVSPTRQVAQSVIAGIGAPPKVGDIVCKNGRTTGFTCGPAWETKQAWFRSQVCANHGDSGAPVLMGDKLVGMVVAGSDFKAGPITVPLPLCSGGGDLLHQPELSTTMALVLADIDRQGGIGAGFRPF